MGLPWYGYFLLSSLLRRNAFFVSRYLSIDFLYLSGIIFLGVRMHIEFAILPLNKLCIDLFFVSIPLTSFSYALVSFLWNPSLEKNTVPVGTESKREKRTPECNVNVLWRNDHLLAAHSPRERHPNAFVVRPLNFATI